VVHPEAICNLHALHMSQYGTDYKDMTAYTAIGGTDGTAYTDRTAM